LTPFGSIIAKLFVKLLICARSLQDGCANYTLQLSIFFEYLDPNKRKGLLALGLWDFSRVGVGVHIHRFGQFFDF